MSDQLKLPIEAKEINNIEGMTEQMEEEVQQVTIILNNEELPDASIENSNLLQLSGNQPYQQQRDGTNRTHHNQEEEEPFQEEDISSDDESTDQSNVDEDFYNQYCKEVLITDQIDMGMIVDFVKNNQAYMKIQASLSLSEAKKSSLTGLYLHSITGDFQEGGSWWNLSGLFSSRSKEDDKAWKALIGTPRENTIYNWVYEVKKILDVYSHQQILQMVREDKKNKQKPTLKLIKVLYSYLDHFLVIHREHRHFSRSMMTESLPSHTQSAIGDEFDSFEYMQIVNVLKQRRQKIPFRLLRVLPESVHFVNFGGLVQRGSIKIDDLKSKVLESVKPKVYDSNLIMNSNETIQEIEEFDIDNYTAQHQQAIRKIQIMFKNKMRARIVREKYGIDKYQMVLHFAKFNEIEREKTQKIKMIDQSSSEDTDREEQERERRKQHDFWAGKMMAEFPYQFLDLRLEKPIIVETEQKLQCTNCKKAIFNNKPSDDEFLWHSTQFGYFCKNCLHPKESDVEQYIDQLKLSSFNYPRFEGNSRIRNDAIKLKKNRSTAIKGFCYKNKDKQLRRKIFPQKWQWRLNEKRNLLKEHEFMNARPKRTQIMIDLQNRWPPKLQKSRTLISKGYRKKQDNEQRQTIKDMKKIYEIKRRLSGINTYRFKNITNIAIEGFKAVYDDIQDLKADRNIDFQLLLFKPEEKDNKGNQIKLEDRFKITPFKQREFFKNLDGDKEFNQNLLPMVPLCFIKNENKFGIINKKKGELVKSMCIEPISTANSIQLVPSSMIYEIKQKTNKEITVQRFKQAFSLCFFISPQSNNQFKGNRHKNRGMIQIFEILVEWEQDDVTFSKSLINIVNEKLLLNVNINGEDQLHQNFDKNGYLNGIKIFDEVSCKMVVIEKALPHEFAFQNQITFSRYQKFYKHKKPYLKDKVQILMVETQLTEQSKDTLYPYQQLIVLNNAVRVLLNHVPYDIDEYKTYEFMESEDQVQKKFIENNNWLQPLGALGCRSMASFLFFHEQFADNIDNVTLQAKKRPTMIEQFRNDQPKFFKSSVMAEHLKPLLQESDEMSYDLACRNPIHDALDQERLLEFRRQLEIMINFVGKSKNTSATSREILTGIMHRVLADESNNLKAFYTQFFMDDHEDRSSFSKFAVKFSDNQINRHSNDSHNIHYFNNVSHIDPQRTITQTSLVNKNKKEQIKMEKSWFCWKRKSLYIRQNREGDHVESNDGFSDDEFIIKESSPEKKIEKQQQKAEKKLQRSLIKLRIKTEEEFELAALQQRKDENVFGTPIETGEFCQHKQINLDMLNSSRNNDLRANDLGFMPHKPFNTVKQTNKLALQIKSRQDGDSLIPDGTFSVLQSQSIEYEQDEVLINIVDQMVEGGEPELGKPYQEESFSESDFEGGDKNTETEEIDDAKQDSDNEEGYSVEHFYVDFRQVFLQANLQNILGKPKHQIISERNNQTSESSVILKRFYETEGFRNYLETTQIISVIYEDYKQEIENMLAIRLISDCQFVSTVKMITAIAIFYMLFMVLPFLIQIRSKDSLLVFLCCGSMMIVQLFLFGVECIQIKNLTWKVYSNDSFNFVELLQFLVSVVYIIIRLTQSDCYILPKPDDPLEHADAQRVQYWVVANTIFFFIQIIKIMYFMRASINLAKIVKLTFKVFSDVAAFTLFLMFWLTVFTELYHVSGITLFDPQAREKHYPGVSGWSALWLQCFRNSLGDISIPFYTYWYKNEFLNPASRLFFSHYAWFLFILHEFFILICLFNFLIAIVSQSYDNIMDTQEMETTMSKIYLNGEAAILYDVIDFITRRKVWEPSQTFHLSLCLDEYQNCSDQFQGFVRTMKLHTSKEQKITRRQIQESRIDLERQMDIKFSKLESMMLKMDNKFSKLAKVMNPNIELDVDEAQYEAQNNYEGCGTKKGLLIK